MYEAWAIIKNQNYKAGENCSGYSHINETTVKGYSEDQKNFIIEHATKHAFKIGGTPPACRSDHEKGIAMDIYPVPSDFSSSKVEYKKYIKAGVESGLCHNVAGDEPHFVLASEAGTSGSACYRE